MTQSHVTQAQYDRQAQFQHEKRHLQGVVGSIDADIEHKEGLTSPGRISAGDVKAADKVKALTHVGLDELRLERNSPYFGRIDYSTGTDETVKSIYIGNINVSNFDEPQYFIANHNAPIAALYYNPAAGSFKSPKGEQHATVYLKRSLSIEEAHLQDFEDLLRLPTPRMLTERLSGPSAEYMSDAIETLQPEQYEALSRTDRPVLIVQGAAGTGKSIVALQRIAFMLSPFSDIGSLDRPTAERVIMFGPSPAFLQYASKLLPGLDVRGVRQQTVTSWLLEQLNISSSVSLSGGENRVLNDLMTNSRFKNLQVEAHLFKGGLKMKHVIDSRVSEIKRDIQRSIKQQASDISSRLSLDMSVNEFRNRVADAFSIHPEPNAARDYLVEGLAEARLRNVRLPSRRRGSTRSEMLDDSRRAVDRELSDFDLWPHYDFRTVYVLLMSSPHLLMEYTRKGDLDLNEANHISRTVRHNASGRSLGITDLAAVLYLKYKLNGFIKENFEHVVVDEAQDVSPLEIEILRMHSLNDSFTILGDLKQGLLPHRSITNWDQFARMFERSNVSRQEMRLTYRNTRQITQYTNRILKDLHMRTTKTPTPYGRKGERPKLVRSKSAADMGESIADAINELHDLDDVRSIAVLTMWESTAKDIVKVLRSEGIEGVSRLEQGDLIESDIMVSPIILTKGLEFDAVIVANAGKNNYKETDFDKMLLYLACTRARHHLEIHWHGTRSPIVPSIARLAR